MDASYLTAPGLSRRPQTALLLIAHGSRQPEANADLFYLVEQLRRRGLYDLVEASFLELAEPTGEQAAAHCVEQGAERVIFLPYFLAAGVHVQRDLTAICRRLAERFPAVTFRLAQPLGRHPLLLDVVADRARQAEEGSLEPRLPAGTNPGSPGGDGGASSRPSR